MKKIKRTNKCYIIEVAFCTFFYYLFGWAVLGLSGEKTFLFFVSLLIFGILYGFVCTEIFTRKNYSYYTYQIIAIPILILVIALNYNFLLLM